jgi:hypothetical protein
VERRSRRDEGEKRSEEDEADKLAARCDVDEPHIGPVGARYLLVLGRFGSSRGTFRYFGSSPLSSVFA